MSDPLLEVKNLKTQFFTEEGVVRAVDGISFTVNEGEIVGLVGESGAGKSVAAQSILRLVERPGEIVGGEVLFKGQPLVQFEEVGKVDESALEAEQTEEGAEAGVDVDAGPVVREEANGALELQPTEAMLSNEEMRKRIRGREIAIIFQDPMESLNPVYTVGGQLREFIEINRNMGEAEAKELAIQMLREVGIPEAADRYTDYPHQFSGGMRQRVLIAMALSCEPSLIIADEPTTALDVTVEAQILELVDELQDKYGTSFIWVTHDMGVIAEISDRVNVMYLGEIVEQAEVDDLFHDTKHPYTDALLDSLPRPDQTVEELRPIAGVMPEAINPPSGCRFHPRCPEAREVCTRVHPTPEVVSVDGAPHLAACFRNDDAFDVGYWESEPIEMEAGAGFGAGLAEDRGESSE
jgi:peptide/nickel transport system ATP-binding protein